MKVRNEITEAVIRCKWRETPLREEAERKRKESADHRDVFRLGLENACAYSEQTSWNDKSIKPVMDNPEKDNISHQPTNHRSQHNKAVLFRVHSA